MNLGNLWRDADAASTTNEVLFSSNDHFIVTMNVLNGEWKIVYLRTIKSKWAIGESPKDVDIETVDGQWWMK